MYRTSFSVHRDDVASDCHSTIVGHALMPQADAKDWYSATEASDDIGGDARFFWGARAGGDDDGARKGTGVQSLNLFGGDFVVAYNVKVALDGERGVDFAEPLHEVPREAVVVVYQEDHGLSGVRDNLACTFSNNTCLYVIRLYVICERPDRCLS